MSVQLCGMSGMSRKVVFRGLFCRAVGFKRTDFAWFGSHEQCCQCMLIGLC